MSGRRRNSAAATPDSHDFPTRPYDLVKEFVVSLTVVAVLTVALAAVFSSPDGKAISLADWAKAAPNDVVATATAELAGTSGTAGYGAPYNKASDGQVIGPLKLQKWLGVRVPVDAANDLVINPVSSIAGDDALTAALQTWKGATAQQQSTWSNAYAEALGKAPEGDPTQVESGDYGPVPLIAGGLLRLAQSGGLEGALTSSETFYVSDETKPMLLLADGAYLEERAVAQHLAGDQWGMMNEVGNWPGQAWLWLYTFWYQIDPFKTSGNADALVWGLMMLLTLALLLVPFIPGVRSIPRMMPFYKLVWRDWYREHPRS